MVITCQFNDKEYQNKQEEYTKLVTDLLQMKLRQLFSDERIQFFLKSLHVKQDENIVAIKLQIIDAHNNVYNDFSGFAQNVDNLSEQNNDEGKIDVEKIKKTAEKYEGYHKIFVYVPVFYTEAEKEFQEILFLNMIEELIPYVPENADKVAIVMQINAPVDIETDDQSFKISNQQYKNKTIIEITID